MTEHGESLSTVSAKQEVLHEGQPREMVVQNFPSQVPPPGAVKQNFIQS